ncbi:MAG: helix-turn-helix domain-containing protein [Ktedonobacteraceae bacterium]|nr:helix-turn-helix domain-containing protein [Ktedonobacteraceae bacterium]
MESKFYTAEEAMKLLGMAKTTFYKEVEAGTIPSVIEKGRKRGRRFPKEAIDVHVKLQRQRQGIHRTFGRATNADLWTAIEYDRELYGANDIISYKRALEWREQNSEIFMMMKDGDELSGTVTFIPLEENTIHALIHDKIRERHIPDWAIRKWTDAELSVYIPTLSIFPTGDKTLDKGRGRSLLCYAIRWALSLNRQYDIKNWYALAATEDGLHLLKTLGFSPVEGTRKGYVLNDIEQAIPIIRDILKRMDTEEHWPVPMVFTSIRKKEKAVPGKSI